MWFVDCSWICSVVVSSSLRTNIRWARGQSHTCTLVPDYNGIFFFTKRLTAVWQYPQQAWEPDCEHAYISYKLKVRISQITTTGVSLYISMTRVVKTSFYQAGIKKKQGEIYNAWNFVVYQWQWSLHVLALQCKFKPHVKDRVANLTYTASTWWTSAVICFERSMKPIAVYTYSRLFDSQTSLTCKKCD